MKNSIIYSKLKKSRGATLIELLVGITIGLMTIAAATGAVIVSRGLSGTVSDASQLQQQASLAFRVLGQQIRQAGSIQLNLAAKKSATDPIDPRDVVAFPSLSDFPTLSGKDNPSTGEYKLTVGHQNYTESLLPTGAQTSPFRDCVGAQMAPDAGTPSSLIVQSNFVLENSELKCKGYGAPQPIIRNVADFQVTYLKQANAIGGEPTIQRVTAATLSSSDWKQVFGIEICITLYGDESINLPSGSKYKDCENNDVIITSLSDTTRKNRLHLTFKSIYQLRSQGMTSKIL